MDGGKVRLRARQVLRRDGRPERKTGDLGQCVNAGIGAAGALGQGSFAGDAAECRLQFALNGRLAGLDLPAAEVGAVVGQSQLPGSA